MKKIKTKKRLLNIKLLLIPIIFILSLYVSSGLLSRYLLPFSFSQIQNSTESAYKNQYADAKNYPTCNFYLGQDIRSYLKFYEVKKGDTLLSITKEQLGNPSRIQEMINLNKEYYPELSTSNSFIEQGWQLVLPPKNKITSGNIKVFAGNISWSKHESNAFIVRHKIGGSRSNLHILDKSLELKKNLYPDGNCVVIIYDWNEQAFNTTLIDIQSQ